MDLPRGAASERGRKTIEGAILGVRRRGSGAHERGGGGAEKGERKASGFRRESASAAGAGAGENVRGSGHKGGEEPAPSPEVTEKDPRGMRG
jgi:hypothetical protein